MVEEVQAAKQAAEQQARLEAQRRSDEQLKAGITSDYSGDTAAAFHDIQKLIQSFDSLIARGHTIIVIEHHHDIIKVADWVIDIGLEGGRDGGELLFAGTPEQLVEHPTSYTARFLRDKLKGTSINHLVEV